MAEKSVTKRKILELDHNMVICYNIFKLRKTLAHTTE